MRIAVIDADPIAYICSKDSLEESLSSVDSLIGNALNAVHCTHYYMFLSDTPYFRHEVNKEYKGKRPSSKLLFLKEIKEHLRVTYGGVSYPGLEADDLNAFVMYYCGDVNSDTYINMSIDKDVLKSVWGKWFNFKKFESGETSIDDALKFLFIQALMGDSTDNITGIPKVGEVKATKIIESCESINEMRSRVLAEYCKYYKSSSVGIYEFQKNFRQVYLLRKNQDFINEVGYIPKLPKLRQI
tara:strand:+ start:17085 stop:17810 length:726 start_codon:yes stop_codon:yes gene_type:complete